MKMRKEKGITLVALVVTIIVLLILSAVSIKSVMNGGLIVNAKTGKEKWDTAKTGEEEKVGSLLEKIEGKHGESEKEQLTIENSSGAKLINYKIYGNTNAENNSIGDYDDTPEKYKIPVTVSGKNLIDVNSIKKMYNRNGLDISNYYSLTDGVINNKYGLYNLEAYMPCNVKTLSAGTYTLSCEVSKISTKSVYFGLVLQDSVITSSKGLAFSNDWSRFSYTFTLEEETTIKGILLQEGGDSSNHLNLQVLFKNIQLEKSDVVTDYEPYVEPITTNIYLNEPLRKLEDVADYIDFKSQKVVRYIKEENGVLSLIENGPTEEQISLPEIPTINGTTILTVDTTVLPSKIEVNYESK